jgi:hypothetical protein
MKKFLFVSLALAGMMAMAPRTHAALQALAVGSTVSPLSTYTETGTAIATVTGTFATPAGTYTETVYRESGGTLNFDFSVTNTSTSDVIERITTAQFTGFTTSVAYSGTTVVPTDATRGAGAGAGVIGFDFPSSSTNGAIGAGNGSSTLIIATNAVNFGSGTISVQDGTSSTGVPSAFAPAGPAAVVPEPSSLAIAGLGALGLIGYGLRRRKAKGA